ncbi:hypothetical protein EB74_02640 [Mycobacterium sp. SWH-M5]|uniref:Transmembrane protein n=1 Tax=Mycolicibacterium goodii TaxID=134601 RepID=A0ABS6HLC2_MYCGD|nr:hypothetical protein [Mycolicibacterium goodii]MBU8823489.1 hypothetical protein [Mycolicibacterium goodii]MBU8835462.1 hypothetical protein [Mycolicibacterium goodii]OKH66971.1 hypothetical protein EB74_02640 [Mycobacterium sp. SWH-M5]
MTDVANVTTEPAAETPVAAASADSTTTPGDSTPVSDAPDDASPAPVVASSGGQRTWSMPKSPISREQADQAGRAALKAAAAIARVLVEIARYGARTVAQLWRVIEAVPAAVRLFAVAAIVMLLGIVGAVAANDALALLCTVVVIPVCAMTLGALGHRWYSGLGGQPAQTSGAAVESSDLQRSVEYVDKKLAVALTSIGTERHQQALISLFQAKTALELTLGTEQDSAGHLDMPVLADHHPLRPRIRVGTKAPLRESNSLAAS